MLSVGFGPSQLSAQEKNMPTFADGHDKDAPAAGFTFKPASKHTAKANREAAKHPAAVASYEEINDPLEPLNNRFRTRF